jgi:hypothetical protein
MSTMTEKLCMTRQTGAFGSELYNIMIILNFMKTKEVCSQTWQLVCWVTMSI